MRNTSQCTNFLYYTKRNAIWGRYALLGDESSYLEEDVDIRFRGLRRGWNFKLVGDVDWSCRPAVVAIKATIDGVGDRRWSDGDDNDRQELAVGGAISSD